MQKEGVDTSRRMIWMDTARGFAILLVILQHSAAAAAIGGIATPEWSTTITDLFTPFRIPLLVFISGFLLEHSLAKGGTRYFSGKIRSVLWPFIIWSIITVGILQESFTLDGIATALTRDPSVLWYLQFLILSYIAFYFVHKSKVSLYVAAPVFLLGSTIVPELFLDITKFDRYVYLFGILLVGVIVARHIHKWRSLVRKPVFLAATGVPAVWLMSISLAGIDTRWDATYAPWTVCAFAFIIGLLMHLPEQWSITKVLSFIGKNSLIYYVLHFSLLVIIFRFIGGWDIVTANRSLAIIGVYAAIIALISIFVLIQKRYPVLKLPFELPRRSKK